MAANCIVDGAVKAVKFSVVQNANSFSAKGALETISAEKKCSKYETATIGTASDALLSS
jgi:hypothetical protein